VKCLLDLDGVLVDFVGGSCKFYGFPDPYLDPTLKGIWDFVKAKGLKDFWKPLGADFWANLEPTQDMREILRIVESKFGQTNVCLLTSPCPDNLTCPEGKLRWIDKYMPSYNRQYLMGPRKEFCARSSHWLVDDSDANVDAFRKNGGSACLVPRIWNSLNSKQVIPHLLEILR